jgi:hypothetical protein
LLQSIKAIRNIKTDFYSGVALNLERLAAEIEAEDMQVAKQMESVRDSKRKSEESIKINQ